MRGDILDSLLWVAVEMRDAFVQLPKQLLDLAIQAAVLSNELSRGHNFPAAPRRVYLAYPTDLARVIKFLGREVLPHEEISLPRVHSVAQVLKVVQHDGVGEGLRLACGEPVM